jgi:hypothetical protein
MRFPVKTVTVPFQLPVMFIETSTGLAESGGAKRVVASNEFGRTPS